MGNKKKFLSIIISVVTVFVLSMSIMLTFLLKDNKNYKLNGGEEQKIEAVITGAAEADISQKGGAIFLEPNSSYKMTGGSIIGSEQIYGGAVYVSSGATFDMYGGTISNCEAEYGGAIYIENGGTVNIYAGTIEGSQAVKNATTGTGGNGGAIYVEAGGTLNIKPAETEAKTMNSSTNKPIQFNDNIADVNGGAIYIENGGTVNIYAGTIDGNEATYGGAIYVEEGGKLTINNATISSNNAIENGGGIYTASGNENVIIKGVITENTAKQGAGIYSTNSLVLTDVEISKNTAETYGGGVYVTGADFKMSGNVTISENLIYSETEKTGCGGGIALIGTNATFNGGTISNNESSYRAAAIYISGKNSTTEVIGATNITGNSAVGDGGGIMVNSGKLYIGTADETYIGSFSENESAGGGAIYLTGSNSILYHYNGTISNNTAPRGGAILVYTSASYYLLGGTIQGNLSNNGAICLSKASSATTGGYMLFEGGLITANTNVSGGQTVEGYGCAVYIDTGCELEINGGTISEHHNASSGALHVKGVLTLKDALFENNSATSGGAIYNAGKVTATVSQNGSVEFTSCSATNGGAIYTNGTGTVELEGGEISGCSANNSGGAIYALGAVELHNTNISGCSATNGGAIYGKQTTITLDSSTLNSNIATNIAGGIYFNIANGQISNSTLSSNKAKRGGGIYMVGQEGDNASLSLDSNTTINENITTSHGGGIYISFADLTTSALVTKNSIEGNTSTAYGGGIYAYNSNVLMVGGEISHHDLIDNQTITRGGGIAIMQGSTFTMTGGTICNNTAEKGGGIKIKGTYTLEDGSIKYNKVTVNGGTIKDNISLTGGAIAVQGESTFDSENTNELIITKATITGNKTCNYGGAINMTRGHLIINAKNNTDVIIENNGVVFDSKSIHNGAVGGAITIDGGIIDISGGTIQNNYIEVSDDFIYSYDEALGNYVDTGNSRPFGGGVYLTNYALLNISGGIIHNNKVNSSIGVGGNVFLRTSCSLNMTGGTISGDGVNAQATYGGGIAVMGGIEIMEPESRAGTISITGGIITNCKASIGGDAIIMSDDITLGNATINGEIGVTATLIYDDESENEYEGIKYPVIRVNEELTKSFIINIYQTRYNFDEKRYITCTDSELAEAHYVTNLNPIVVYKDGLNPNEDCFETTDEGRYVYQLDSSSLAITEGIDAKIVVEYVDDETGKTYYLEEKTEKYQTTNHEPIQLEVNPNDININFIVNGQLHTISTSMDFISMGYDIYNPTILLNGEEVESLKISKSGTYVIQIKLPSFFTINSGYVKLAEQYFTKFANEAIYDGGFAHIPSSLRNQTVVGISVEGFKGATIKSLTLPETLLKIENYAFYDCTYLETITFNCIKLNALTGNSTNTAYDNYAFYNAGINSNGITVNVGPQVTTLSSYLFRPSAAYEIDRYGNYVPDVNGNNKLLGSPNIVSLNLDEAKSLTTIGEKLFMGVATLTGKINFPSSLEKIQSNAFDRSGISDITSIKNTHVTSIGVTAFASCVNLTGEIVLPATLETIERYAFRFCPYLTHIDLTNCSRLTHIDVNAFARSTGLKSIYIPASVTNIMYNSGNTGYTYSPFYRCSNDLIIFVGAESKPTGFSNDWNSYDDGLYLPTYYNVSVEAYRYYLETGCVISGTTLVTCINAKKSEIVIPAYVTEIAADAFKGENLITSITFADGTSAQTFAPVKTATTSSGSMLTKIGANAFYGCSSLQTIEIPSLVTSIGTYAFYNCSGIRNVQTQSVDNWLNITFGNASANPMSVTTLEKFYVSGTETTELNINVSAIKSHAFYGFNNLTDLTLGNSVTSIGTSAFSGCSNITSIRTPSLESWLSITFTNTASNPMSVTTLEKFYVAGTETTELDINVSEIKPYAFYGFNNLTDLTLGSGVTSIGTSAFSGCSNITKLDLNCNIAARAFESLSALTDLTIGNNVTSIGTNAFSGCSKITRLTIGSGLTGGISKGMFGGCASLKTLTTLSPVSNEGFKDLNKNLTSVTVCANIGSSAFYGCSALNNLTIDGVQSIGDSAFYGCEGLTNLEIPVYLTNIGKSAFSYCSNLSTITINGLSNNSVVAKTIGENAFLGCSKIEVVKTDSIDAWVSFNFANKFATPTYYSEKLFAYDILVEYKDTENSDDLPNNGEIYKYITLNLKVDRINDYTLYNVKEICGVNSGLYTEDEVDHFVEALDFGSATTIGKYAFYNATFGVITLGDDLLTIGESAFAADNEGTNLKIENWGTKIETVGLNAFKNREVMFNITTVDSWAKIDFANEYANPFYASGEKSFLVNYTITSNLNILDAEKVGSYAFYGLEFNNILIGNQVQTIGNYAFAESGINNWIYFCDYNAPDNSNLTIIGDFAFANITTERENDLVFTIPKNVRTIGNNAFRGISALLSIDLSEELTTIGEEAFEDCSNLRMVEVKDKLTSVGSEAFNECSALQYVVVSDINAWAQIDFAKETSNPLYYTKKLYLSGTEPSNEITAVNLTTAKKVGTYAFINCLNLSSLKIGDNVTIGNGAFYGCTNITSLTIGKGQTSVSIGMFGGSKILENLNTNSNIASDGFANLTTLKSVTIGSNVTSIGAGAFYECSNLTRINAESVESWAQIDFESSSSNPLCYTQNFYVNGSKLTTINLTSATKVGSYAFYEYDGLTSVTLGNSVKTIGFAAFEGCSNITQLKIDDGVLEIGNWAFGGCSNLTSVTIPNSVTSISDYAFFLSGLTSVTIPNGVTEIGKGSFESCYNLKTVTIGEGVEKIGTDAFKSCPIETLTVNSNKLTINKSMFDGCVNLKTLITNSDVSSGGFSGLTNLANVSIGENVRYIGSGAFSGSGNEETTITTYYNEEITNIIFNSEWDSGFVGRIFYGSIGSNVSKIEIIDYNGYGSEIITNVANYSFTRTTIVVTTTDGKQQTYGNFWYDGYIDQGDHYDDVRYSQIGWEFIAISNGVLTIEVVY